MTTEFGVTAVDQIGESEIAIAGRVFSRVVDLQTCFSKLLEYEQVSPEIAANRKVVGLINLKVVKIVCYRREIDCLEGGLTGLLVVKGTGIDQVRSGLGLATGQTVVPPSGNTHTISE